MWLGNLPHDVAIASTVLVHSENLVPVPESREEGLLYVLLLRLTVYKNEFVVHNMAYLLCFKECFVLGTYFRNLYGFVLKL